VTVAAVVLAASPESALADADGMSRVRRIVDAAWSGGAMPVVVVAPDPDGSVAAALAGAEVTIGRPAPVEGGPVAQIVRGIEIAAGEVVDTTAVLVWPAHLCWVGPETATSLIEAHGAHPDAVLRPEYDGQPGWPALVPIARLEAMRKLGADHSPEGIIAELTTAADGLILALGDPGSVIDGDTRRTDLPPYLGPAEPTSEHHHEWGEFFDPATDEAPVGGPRRAE
jgi:CTP:molybdopterin cytidylyltransferase MocA